MKRYRIKNILVPTDFSRIARYALHYAERIASLTGARITLLNVVEPIGNAIGTSGMLGVSSGFEQKQQAATMRRFQRIARASSKRSGVRMATLAVIGRITPVITKVATKTHADLIIMGTHGATGFVEKLLGTNTYRIASLARTPLMSVHKDIGRSGFKHIVYPIRDQRRAIAKLPQALVFAKLFKADVHIVGLLRPDQQEHEQNMRAACDAVQRAFIRKKVAARATFLFDEYFPDAVIRYAHDHHSSLVIIVQDSDFHLVELFQGTFTKRILHTILSPVLTVPSQA
jgi:nucleotide-binding universal stress UspA family protein